MYKMTFGPGPPIAGGCIKRKNINLVNPILDTRISVRTPSVMLVLPPMKSETGWTGELWSNRVLLILEN